MAQDIAPLFTRLKQRFTRLPASVGISFELQSAKEQGFARAKGRRIQVSSFACSDELIRLLCSGGFPEVCCICAPLKLRSHADYQRILSTLRLENINIVTTDPDLLLAHLGLQGSKEELARWFAAMGLEVRPATSDIPHMAIMASLMGYFFLNNEFEFLPAAQSIVPLLFEGNPLFSFLRQVPYGEVTTFTELAKALGLHWNEERVTAELARLAGGAEVFAHRLVHRDGGLNSAFPGGKELQREMLKREMVPFLPNNNVDLKRALWTKHKYRPLANYLRYANANSRFTELYFDEIESILGVPLPHAARRLGSWWSDDRPHAYVWQAAGCQVAEVNMQLQKVVFSRKSGDFSLS